MSCYLVEETKHRLGYLIIFCSAFIVLCGTGHMYMWAGRIKQHGNRWQISWWFTLGKSETNEHKPQSLPKAISLSFIFLISFNTEMFRVNGNIDTVRYIARRYNFESVTWQRRFSIPRAPLSSQADRSVQRRVLVSFPRRLMELSLPSSHRGERKLMVLSPENMEVKCFN